jgi:hypothetical protein
MKIIKFKKKSAEISSNDHYVRLPFVNLPIQNATAVR